MTPDKIIMFDNPSYPIWKSGYDQGFKAGAEAMREKAKEEMNPMLRDMISRGQAVDLIVGVKLEEV